MEEIDAQRVYGYALFKDGKRIRLAYPLEKFHTDVSGRSFHNGRFIQRMREKAASLPKYVSVSQIVLVYVKNYMKMHRTLFESLNYLLLKFFLVAWINVLFLI